MPSKKLFSMDSKVLSNIRCIPGVSKPFPLFYNTKNFAGKVHAKGFKCCFCTKTFPLYSEALAHFNEHIDVALYACEVCREGFQQQKDLQGHLYRVHGEKTCLPAHSKVVYQKCSHCSKYFRLFDEFEEHSSSCNSSTYACNICQVIFSTLSALDEHKLSEHKLGSAAKGYAALRNGKRYFCGICYLGFFKGDILQKHLMTHKMEMIYICDVCYENFSCDNDLQLHYLQHIEEQYALYDIISQYSCRSCMKTFKTQKELKEHLILKNCENADKNSFVIDCELKELNSGHSEYASVGVNSEITSQDVDISFDTSETHIYALKSGEELLNCDDSKCIIIIDFTSLFVLQRGICASENRMPNVRNSEAYNETDVIDESLLQNHMFQIFNSNNGNNLVVSDEFSGFCSNVEASLLEENINIDSGSVEAAAKFNEMNDNSLKLDVLEGNESPLSF